MLHLGGQFLLALMQLGQRLKSYFHNLLIVPGVIFCDLTSYIFKVDTILLETAHKCQSYFHSLIPTIHLCIAIKEWVPIFAK